MKRLRLYVAIVTFFVVSLVSCGTTSAFNGPVSDRPSVSIQYLRHMVSDDPRLPFRVETIATAAITNPSLHEMTAILDCTESRHTLELPARTTTDVLLDPRDASCELLRYRST